MTSVRFEFEKDEWAENHGITVGHCNIHKVKVWDGDCDKCQEEDREEELRWTCMECEEVRFEDARVEAGMKCGHCAYGRVDYDK